MPYRKPVIKIGSQAIVNTKGQLDSHLLSAIADQVAVLHGKGVAPIVVSSGAVACGSALIGDKKFTDHVTRKQALAAVGQPVLLTAWQVAFAKHQIICGQILITSEDLRDPSHLRNIRNCIDALHRQGIVPIVNENDTVSISELMFTDNDELAAQLTLLTNADCLILLTLANGVLTAPPDQPNSRLIEVIENESVFDNEIEIGSGTTLGRGGMRSKCNQALRISKVGIATFIAHAHRANVLPDIVLNSVNPGTYFVPAKKIKTPKAILKILERTPHTGAVVLNSGAVSAITQNNKAASLLPVGITDVIGPFKKDDVIQLLNPDHEVIGLGKVAYGSTEALKLAGKKNAKPLVHYDYMYIANN